MIKTTPEYYRYWGKVARSESHEENQHPYHLLVYHSLDVAAVGWCWLDPDKEPCRRLAELLAVEPAWLQNSFAFFLALHDIGKFCRSFQNLVFELSDQLVPYDQKCQSYDGRKARHDSLGFCLWQKTLEGRLRDLMPGGSRLLKPWLEVVCGHHGQPPKNTTNVRSFSNEEDEHAAELFVRHCFNLFQPDLEALEQIDKKILKQVSWQLAGTAVLADWLGSDQGIFTYQSRPVPLAEYWSAALKKAGNALGKAAFSPRDITPFTSIRQQFDFIQEPTPLQAYAQNCEITDEPQLFILEDVTGAGKTEAAMVLTHRLMSAGLARGLYVGLPTMATANAMYERLAASYRKLYSDSAQVPPSLVLAHGASKLSEAFRNSVQISQRQPDRDYDSGDETASAYCNAWLADSRKKALLADVGVGTIDQTLLGILPARHQSLRLLGLSGKVLLVDEVHAYDGYMQQLLITLLKTHSALGGSAILLSATLPRSLRQQLVNAYGAGRPGHDQPVALGEKQVYPLVTRYSRGDGLREHSVETRDSVRRSVTVCRLSSEADVIATIGRVVAEGGCVCWVRNTVGDAFSAFQTLAQDEQLRDSLTLFHSRFAMVDRQAIEADVLSRFGKASTPASRKGQVLIATQVVEQSLDLDFDVMISDLAPIDSLIQRAGRLQRHLRDQAGNRLAGDGLQDQRHPPCLYLLSPDPERVTGPNWLSRLLPGSQWVYKHTGQLWLTIRVLQEKNGFTMPADARHLIESVYGEQAQDAIPDALVEASQDALAEGMSQRDMGRFNRLAMDKGYTLRSGEISGGWSEDTHIPTRLSADSVTAVLARVDEQGGLEPYARTGHCPWALSQISLPQSQWQVAQGKIPSRWQAAIEQLQATEPALRWLQVLPLTGELAGCYSPGSGWCVDRKDK